MQAGTVRQQERAAEQEFEIPVFEPCRFKSDQPGQPARAQVILGAHAEHLDAEPAEDCD